MSNITALDLSDYISVNNVGDFGMFGHVDRLAGNEEKNTVRIQLVFHAWYMLRLSHHSALFTQ